MIFVLFNTIKNRISNVWPCYIARVLPVTKFSTSLLKFLLKLFASSSFLLVLLLLFKIIDSLWKAFSEKRGPTTFQIFYSLRQLYDLVSPKKLLLVFAILGMKFFWLTQNFFWRLKRLLGSFFFVFKNLFLSFNLFIIDFLSSFDIKLQLFERLYLILWSVLVKNR